MSIKVKDDSPLTLGLSTVLLGSLPATLMTRDAPDYYTVEAVFTRRADRDEIAAIQAGATRDHLSAAGYPTIELHVSDRRLEISNTNLEQLRDGLGAVVAELLATISGDLRMARELAAGRFRDASERERQRSIAVAVLARSVHFAYAAAALSDDDADRISDWMEEGGALLA